MENLMADLNPQAKQMADESMVRGLEAQARAIWPQESRLLERYALPMPASSTQAAEREKFPRAWPNVFPTLPFSA
jgi:hypothetical protein